jgi:hypothetical protein
LSSATRHKELDDRTFEPDATEVDVEGCSCRRREHEHCTKRHDDPRHVHVETRPASGPVDRYRSHRALQLDRIELSYFKDCAESRSAGRRRHDEAEDELDPGSARVTGEPLSLRIDAGDVPTVDCDRCSGQPAAQKITPG